MKKKHHTTTTQTPPDNRHHKNTTTQHNTTNNTHTVTPTHTYTGTQKLSNPCEAVWLHMYLHDNMNTMNRGSWIQRISKTAHLNPANMKIKAIESSEYANWIRRCPKKIIFKCNKIPRQKRGNSNSYKKCNKFSTTSRIQRIWKLGQLNPANMKSKAIESSEYANQA